MELSAWGRAIRAAGKHLPKLREHGDDVAFGELVRETTGVDVRGIRELCVPAGLAGDTLRKRSDSRGLNACAVMRGEGQLCAGRGRGNWAPIQVQVR
jgi:hypothetical protein